MEPGGRTVYLAFIHDRKTIASADPVLSTVQLLDMETRKVVATLPGHANGVQCIAYSPMGGILASGSQDNTTKYWDRRTDEYPATVNVGSIVYGVAFSPDRTRLASGCSDTTIRIVDVISHQEVAGLHGHRDYVHAVAWSSDGTRLVSASGDHTLRIWDSLSIKARADANVRKPTND